MAHPWNSLASLKTDCRWFRGDVPCAPHKQHGIHCVDNDGRFALNKKIVLFNNIFNRHGFELYGLGEILEPDFDCPCYFTPVCPNDCMQYISVERVLKACTTLLKT